MIDIVMFMQTFYVLKVIGKLLACSSSYLCIMVLTSKHLFMQYLGLEITDGQLLLIHIGDANQGNYYVSRKSPVEPLRETIVPCDVCH